jgi:hypothetical protein
MAGEASGLTYVLDENLGPRTLELLRLAKMPPVGRITSLAGLGFASGVSDEEWMPALGTRGRHVAITRDGEILRASVRLEAWRTSGITLMILDGRWGQLSIAEIARGLIYWWPYMTEAAEAAAVGSAWTVPHNVPAPPRRIRLVTPRLGGGRAQALNVANISAPRGRRRADGWEAF